MTTPKIEQVIEGLLKIRDKRAELKAAFKIEDDKLAEMEERGENWLLSHLTDLGVDNVKTQFGTAFTQTKMRSSIGDWGHFSTWAAETGNVDLLQHRLNEANLKTYMESSGNQLPPGVATSPVRTITIRRS